jgi:membrane protease YdiL (CAAX protease family)
MRSFLKFVVLLLAALLAAAAVTYPAWLAVKLVSDQPVHRVMHRLAMLFALLGLLWLVHREQLGYRAALGYGLPGAQFLRQALVGFAAGLALLLPFILLLLALNLRVPKETATWTAVLHLLPAALLSGLGVALIEETFFRGILQSAVARDSGFAASLILPSALYAAVHFLGGQLRLPDTEVQWSVGFQVFAKLFEKYAAPLALIDSLAALFVVGVLLGLIRARTQAIAACIGLHASWVTLIAVTRRLTLDNTDNPRDWLTGQYDGVIGWGAFVWTLLVLLLIAHRLRQVE